MTRYAVAEAPETRASAPPRLAFSGLRTLNFRFLDIFKRAPQTRIEFFHHDHHPHSEPSVSLLLSLPISVFRSPAPLPQSSLSRARRPHARPRARPLRHLSSSHAALPSALRRRRRRAAAAAVNLKGASHPIPLAPCSLLLRFFPLSLPGLGGAPLSARITRSFFGVMLSGGGGNI